MVTTDQEIHREIIVIDGHKITVKLPSKTDPAIFREVRDTLFQSSYLARKGPEICK